MFRTVFILFKQPHPFRFLISRLLPRLGVRLYIDYFGVKICLGRSKLSQSLFAEGCVQRKVDADFIVNHLEIGDVYVDIGANIGTLALLASKKVGPSGFCIAIEPNWKTFCELVQNVQINDLPVACFMTALGDSCNFARFTDKPADDQNSVVTDGPLSIYMATLDALLSGVLAGRRVKLLKIDVEGFEYFVLKGAKEILALTDIVYFEVSDGMLSGHGLSPSDLLSLLSDSGFIIKQVDGAVISDISKASFPKTQNLVAIRQAH